MAADKLVDSTQLDADLTSVANAIRTKGGTSASLVFPSGFVSAVQAIPSGGGSSYSDMVDAFAKHEISGDIVLDSSVTKFPITYFMSGQPITSFRADGLTRLESYSFLGCSALESISFPNLINLYASQCFKDCTSLTIACFPKLGGSQTASATGYLYNGTFYGCTSLETADLNTLGTSSRGLTATDFFGCTSLKTLILRKTDGICPLGNVNVFQNTPFASGGSGGTVYVPQALISSYQTATNWSTLYAGGATTFAAIEGSIYETQYADGTPVA